MLLVSAALTVKPVYAASYDTTGAVLRVALDKRTLALDPKPAMINREAYLPLRAICEKMGGAVQWDAAKNQAVVMYRHRTYPINGVILDNRLMVTPEVIGSIFDLNAAYDPVLSVVMLDHGERPSQEQLLGILPQYDRYGREDLYWLSRIVEAEATGESYESRLAVANVIINRLNNEEYPDTIKEVIFDRKYGVQFSPVANGSVYNDPSTLSFLAALDALEGHNNASGALFFMNPKYATSFWMEQNRQFAFTIGGHSYYY